MTSKRASRGLSETDSHVLAVIRRNQPISAYQVRHAVKAVLVRGEALSQGSVYPAIERLKSQQLVTGERLSDGRKTELLSCTPAGEKAIKAWLLEVPEQLPVDPLRDRVLSLPLLDKEERLAWLRSAKETVFQCLATVDESSDANGGTLFELAQDSARSALLAQIRWLERIEPKLAEI